MITPPTTEDLAKVLFAADGFDVTKWDVLTSEQGTHVREHYRTLAKVSIDWLMDRITTTVTTPTSHPAVRVAAWKEIPGQRVGGMPGVFET